MSASASDVRALAVPDGLDGERLDAALSRLFGFSRTRAVELIGQGRVQLDGGAPIKSDRVAAGSWLQVELPAVAEAGPAIVSTPVADMLIVHDDADIVVVDKPVGVAAHPSPGWDGPTVVGALVAAGYRVSTSGAEERQGVVHRLDVGTSGLMVVAKSEPAYTALKQAFRDRTVDKTYHALVQGHPDPARGTIDAPIDRHPVHDYKFAVVADGKPSITHYETLEAHAMASLLEIKLETGRTHQIRVHMAALRHPCVGDLAYGADPTLAAKVGLTRQWLHAAKLAFAHPADGRWIEFTSEYPADLSAALQLVRAGLEGGRRGQS
jgi:23S rRNA pseudouridine1911/1915/1917 synthase